MQPFRLSRSALLASAATTAIACGESKKAAPPDSITTARAVESTSSQVASGDTTTVVTHANGVWGPAFDAVEIFRLRSNSEESTFGLIRDVASRPDGGVLVFDAKGIEGPVLRAFDADGRFLHNISRAGSGPGEYANTTVRITVQPDGSILLNDAPRAVNRYAANGAFLVSFRELGSGGRAELLRGTENSFYSQVSLHSTLKPTLANAPSVTGNVNRFGTGVYFRYDSSGRLLDSTVYQGRWLKGTDSTSQFSPSQSWQPLPDRRILVTRTDILGFMIVDPSGASGPLVAHVPTEPAEFTDEERAEWEAALRQTMHGTKPSDERVPRYKPVAGSVQVDMAGRIWIQKQVKSEKVEPWCTRYSDNRCLARSSYRSRPVYVAFNQDGTYLGEMRFPLTTSFVRFARDYAWAVDRGADDEQILVKYRIP